MACVIILNSCHARFGKVDALYWLDCCGILYVCGHMLEYIQKFPIHMNLQLKLCVDTMKCEILLRIRDSYVTNTLIIQRNHH